MARNLLGIGGVFAVALLLVGLTFSTTQEAPADFRFIAGAEPKTLDPHLMTGQVEGRYADALFEGLTYRDPETLEPRPGVARSWEISPDKKLYVFHLRPEARWDDGTPITAHDFAWSWRRLQAPELGSEYAYILHVVRGAEAFNAYAGHADLLESTVLPGLKALRADHPGGIPAPAWQRYVAKAHLNDAVKGTTDAPIQAALALKQGVLADPALGALEAALSAEAARRRAAAAHARVHFGVDEGIYARDDHTLVVELIAPTPYFLELTAFYTSFPVPRHLVEHPAHRDDWFLPEKIVGNGPFRLAAWRVNEKMRLVRSPTYWNRDAIALDVIDAFPVENSSAALNLYLTGAVDWNTNPPPLAIVDALRARYPGEYVLNPSMTVYYYRFNCTRKPFDDPRVRRAIALAVDRETIVRHVLRKGDTPAQHIVPYGLPGYEPPPSPLGLKVEEARALLAEAGYPGGRGFPEVKLLYNTLEQHKLIAETVAGDLKRHLGLTVVPFNQEWQAYQATTLAGEYDMARAGWIGDYADPNTFLDLWITNGGNNQTGWSNAAYDRLLWFAADPDRFLAEADAWLGRLAEPERARARIAAVSAAPDPAAQVEAKAALRMHLLREAEALLVTEVPVLPVYFYVNQNLVKPHVKGWHPNPQDIHPLRGLFVQRPEGP